MGTERNPYNRHIAKNFREVYFGGNWTYSCLKDQLKDVNYELATRKVDNTNTILGLVYHIHYYVRGVSQVLNGGKLEIKDKFSFDHPVVSSQEEWENFLKTIYDEAEQFADQIDQLHDELLFTDLDDPKWGDYYRNLHGIIEHAHYHLGQIVILKKLN